MATTSCGGDEAAGDAEVLGASSPAAVQPEDCRGAAQGTHDASPAITWLELRKGSQLEISPQAQSIFQGANGYVNPVMICGRLRIGKSYLMNALLGRNCFGVSGQARSFTKGINIAPELVAGSAFGAPADSPSVALLDLEGQGDKGLAQDVKLATPLLLVSKVVLLLELCPTGPSKESILESLQVMSEGLLLAKGTPAWSWALQQSRPKVKYNSYRTTLEQIALKKMKTTAVAPTPKANASSRRLARQRSHSSFNSSHALSRRLKEAEDENGFEFEFYISDNDGDFSGGFDLSVDDKGFSLDIDTQNGNLNTLQAAASGTVPFDGLQLTFGGGFDFDLTGSSAGGALSIELGEDLSFFGKEFGFGVTLTISADIDYDKRLLQDISAQLSVGFDFFDVYGQVTLRPNGCADYYSSWDIIFSAGYELNVDLGFFGSISVSNHFNILGFEAGSATGCAPAQCSETFCDSWCNVFGIWSCGVNCDGAYCCDCDGCNGCAVEKCPQERLGINYCDHMCNSQGIFGCGVATDTAHGAPYTCNCDGCNGCPVVEQCSQNQAGTDYCNDWCNTWLWPCGINTDGAYTCNCAGCNGCLGCAIVQTPSQTGGGGNTKYLDRHNVHCPGPSSIMNSWHFVREQINNDLVHVESNCCEMPVPLGNCRTAMTPHQNNGQGNVVFLNRLHIACDLFEVLNRWQLQNDQNGGDEWWFEYQCCGVASIGSCRSLSTPANDADQNNWGTSMYYLDRHTVACGEFEAIQAWQLVTPQNDQMQIDYTCCSIGVPSSNTVSPPVPYTNLNDAGGGNTVYFDRHTVQCSDQQTQALNRWQLSGDRPQWQFAIVCVETAEPLGPCRTLSTNWNSNGGGLINYLDRHDVACASTEVLNMWHLENEPGNSYRINYNCCRSPTIDRCYQRSTGLNWNGNGNAYNLNMHNVSCDGGEVMQAWRLINVLSEMEVLYTCCQPKADPSNLLVQPPVPWSNLNDGGNGNTIFFDRHTIQCADQANQALNRWQLSGNPGQQIQFALACVVPLQPLVSCHSISTNWNDNGGGNVQFLDRHNVQCASDEVLNMWHLENNDQQQYRINYQCCESPSLGSCYSRGTGWNANGGGNAYFLNRHNVQCNHKNEMLQSWHLVNEATSFQVMYTCCTPSHATSDRLAIPPAPFTDLNDGGNGNTIFFDRHTIQCADQANQALNRWQLSGNPGQQIQFALACVVPLQPLVSCRTISTNWYTNGGGNAVYLQYHTVQCNSNEVLNMWHLENNDQQQYRINYQCCESPSLGSCSSMGTGINSYGDGNSYFLNRHNVQCPLKNQMLQHWHLETYAQNNYQIQFTCCAVA
eukprot:TRINITY_DN25863_c0_g2_i1.p1 TRINITY_DN25863_c0_g2~~TRINITY_DN25863_c0_g2_i1.p1  ORF type:complete len:1342 (-),score=166.03 TRINITY_DN25863_c0_g2_i1:240-4217(-)